MASWRPRGTQTSFDRPHVLSVTQHALIAPRSNLLFAAPFVVALTVLELRRDPARRLQDFVAKCLLAKSIEHVAHFLFQHAAGVRRVAARAGDFFAPRRVVQRYRDIAFDL